MNETNKMEDFLESLNGKNIKRRILEEKKILPSFFFDRGLVQIVGMPESGKTIFANFLGKEFEESIWITREDSFSLGIKNRISIEKEDEIISILKHAEKIGDLVDIVCIIDPIFAYVFDEENRTNFFTDLRARSQIISIIFTNKYIMDGKKRMFRGSQKMWGGKILRTWCDYIFSIRKINEHVEYGGDIITKVKVDVIKSLDKIPESDIPLTFVNGLIKGG